MPVRLILAYLSFLFSYSCSLKHPDVKESALNQLYRAVYSEDAILVNVADSIYKGRSAIANFRSHSKISETTLKIDTTIEANERRGIYYQLGSIKTDQNEEYGIIRIMEKADTTQEVVFEILAVKDDVKDVQKQIDRAREQWIKLCNAHDTSRLINDMYTLQTIYFNHKPLIIGREHLIPEYSYMNRENYTLLLNPIIVRTINSELVYELGQCSGSYNGKYIIVWRRDTDGLWWVLIDSNI